MKKRIVNFSDFLVIESIRFILKNKEESDTEIFYNGLLKINGENIFGQIFCEKNKELECYQFYNKDGIDIALVYGEDLVDKAIKKEIEKL